GFTTAPPYLAPVASGLTMTPILTTGDVIDRTGVPAQQYRLTGIPDGLGWTITQFTRAFFVGKIPAEPGPRHDAEQRIRSCQGGARGSLITESLEAALRAWRGWCA